MRQKIRLISRAVTAFRLNGIFSIHNNQIPVILLLKQVFYHFHAEETRNICGSRIVSQAVAYLQRRHEAQRLKKLLKLKRMFRKDLAHADCSRTRVPCSV